MIQLLGTPGALAKMKSKTSLTRVSAHARERTGRRS